MEDLKENINSIRENLESVYSNINDILYDIDNLPELLEIDTSNTILDLQLFKDKLELYGLSNEELFNFIDDYMRLYNKE